MSTEVNRLINYHELKPDIANPQLKSIPIEHIQRALLVAAVACSVISLIPNLGLIGALSLRSIACGAAGINALYSIKIHEGKELLVLKIMRLASGVVGLAGVATSINLLVLTALAMEIFYQVGEAGYGAKQKDPYKALCHLSFILINSFTMVALLTGGWQYIVTATTLNSVVMFVFGTKTLVIGIMKKDVNAALDATCYIALGAIGIASAVRAAEISQKIPTKYYYQYANQTGKTVMIYDQKGKLIARLEPGEIASFSLNPNDTASGRIIMQGAFRARSDLIYKYTLKPWRTDTVTEVIQKPMAAEEFPTLPLESMALVTEDPRIREQEISLGEVENTHLATFLLPVLSRPKPCFSFDDARRTVTLVHEGSVAACRLDMESVCELSDYIRGTIDLERQETDTIEFILEDTDRATFTQLTHFLATGIPNRLDTLKETELLKLLEGAEYLQLNNLRLLCLKEVASRLQHVQWKNTRLFEPYYDSENSLSPLIALYNFKPETV